MKENHKGMVRVDAYWIPEEHADAYIARREQAAVIATRALQVFSAKVERCWQGSQDGEAVVGTDAAGEITGLVHLDPDGVDCIHALSGDALIAYLKGLPT